MREREGWVPGPIAAEDVGAEGAPGGEGLLVPDPEPGRDPQRESHHVFDQRQLEEVPAHVRLDKQRQF